MLANSFHCKYTVLSMVLQILFTEYCFSSSLHEKIPFSEFFWREKSPYSEFFWSIFSRIRTEYGKVRSISPYSVRMRENKDQKNSEYGLFSRSAWVGVNVCTKDTRNSDISSMFFISFVKECKA